MMKLIGLVFAVAAGGVVIAGCSQTADSAYSERKQASTNLCTSAVAKRTGNSSLRVYQNLSYENTRTVWIEVQPEGSEFRCTVTKNGPDSYYVQSVRKL